LGVIYEKCATALIDNGDRYLKGLLEISSVKAGLYTAAFLRNGMSSRQAEGAATAHGVETLALDRFTLKRPDPKGFVLGFAAFDEVSLREGIVRLAAALAPS
jgi:GntR family transcriptional regulator/MocR family aminotransferase